MTASLCGAYADSRRHTTPTLTLVHTFRRERSRRTDTPVQVVKSNLIRAKVPKWLYDGHMKAFDLYTIVMNAVASIACSCALPLCAIFEFDSAEGGPHKIAIMPEGIEYKQEIY